ncbi:MAG: trypsin-like peptidase domain-containing protein [bacterium]
MFSRKILLSMIISSLLLSLLFCSPKQESNSKEEVSEQDKIFTTQEDKARAGLNEDIYMSRQNAITNAISRASPAIVGINVIQIKRYYAQDPFDSFFKYYFKPYEYEQKVKGLGSGFLISSDGYILTNEHVVHEATEIVVTMTDGTKFEAELVGSDQKYDVALLKIDGENLPYISLGNSDDIIIGEWVIALGNPFGLFDVSAKPSATVGVVSAADMDFQGEYAIQGRSYTDMIQTDASINGGNSGGPLVNSLGECIGINTFIFSGSQYEKTSIGIGFAIPVNRAKEILPELKKIGKIDRSFSTGLEVKNLSFTTALRLGISPGDGVIVSGIVNGSPADHSNIKVGDVVVMINKQRISSTYDVKQVINRIDIRENNTLELVIYRNGKLKQISLTLDDQH